MSGQYTPIQNVFSTGTDGSSAESLPSIALVVPAVLPAAVQTYLGGSTFRTMGTYSTAGAGIVRSIEKEDRIFVRRVAVFSNFADGLLVVKNPNQYGLKISLFPSVTLNPPDTGNGFDVSLPAFNTWVEVNQFIPFISPNPKYFLSAILRDFSFRPDSIGPEYNGASAVFTIFAETEHTFEIVL